MSLENENKGSPETPQTNPAKERAASSGWRPQDQWDGDPSQWVDYREFNVRGELMGRIQEQSSIINHQKGQMDEFRQALNDMAKMQDKIAESEYKRIMRKLKDAKAAAISEGEGELAADIDEQIDSLKAERDDVATKPQATKGTREEAPQLAPEVQAWISAPKNQWYNTDARMRNFANTIAAEIAQSDPSMQPAEVLRRMEAEIRKEMPHKFATNPVGSGDGTNRSSSRGNKHRGMNDLSEDQQMVAKRLIKTGVFKNVDEYIKQLELIGE